MSEDQSEDMARVGKERSASCSSIKEGRQRQQSEEAGLCSDNSKSESKQEQEAECMGEGGEGKTRS